MKARRFMVVWSALFFSCAHFTASEAGHVDVVVIAPHPDDEVLLAAGVMRQALEDEKRVAVIVMTNGDFTCERNGYVREAETLRALKRIGLDERDVHFLGYPDGDLSVLGATPLPLIERRNQRGQCVLASWTYANGGANSKDEHTARTGRPAEYVAEALTADLAALLARFSPNDVYITHPIDEHPDHASTYAYFRRALDRIDLAPPTVHRGVIHAGPCWPGNCRTPFEPDQVTPALPPPHETYLPTERLPVDPLFKFDAISQYASQTGPVPQLDWLSSFARRDETFYVERLKRLTAGGCVRAPAKATVKPQELTFDVKSYPLVTLVAPDGAEFELLVSYDRVTLTRVEDWSRARIAMWRRPFTESTTLRLRIDPRHDDGVSEWSLWGDEGFIGEAVVMPVDVTIEVKPAPVVAPAEGSLEKRGQAGLSTDNVQTAAAINQPVPFFSFFGRRRHCGGR